MRGARCCDVPAGRNGQSSEIAKSLSNCCPQSPRCHALHATRARILSATQNPARPPNARASRASAPARFPQYLVERRDLLERRAEPPSLGAVWRSWIQPGWYSSRCTNAAKCQFSEKLSIGRPSSSEHRTRGRRAPNRPGTARIVATTRPAERAPRRSPPDVRAARQDIVDIPRVNERDVAPSRAL